MPMAKTTLYLPSELQTELKWAARRLKRPQAELVREALEQYLAEHARPWPKSIGIAAGSPVSAAESEDWIREHWIEDLKRKLPDRKGNSRTQ